MVVLYSNGKKLGTWAEAERLFAEALKNGPVEFRDESGEVIAKTNNQEPICPWEPSLTEAEIERRSKEGGMTLAEFWKKMGVA